MSLSVTMSTRLFAESDDSSSFSPFFCLSSQYSVSLRVFLLLFPVIFDILLTYVVRINTVLGHSINNRNCTVVGLLRYKGALIN